LIPWWSLLLSALALASLGAATAVVSAPPLLGALAVLSMAAVCLVLVVAELVHRASVIQRPDHRS
jgi:hypothetical protein